MCAIKILVVDDSAFMRLTLSRRLNAQPDLEVVGAARDGHDAVAQIEALSPDVVTMDVEMPGLSGLETLERIMAERPVPVVMVSNLTREGAETTVRALTLGAVDFVAKSSQVSCLQETINELAQKIRRAAGTRVGRVPATREPGQIVPSGKAELRPLRLGAGAEDRVIVIGSSTGGPGALRHIMGLLSPYLNASLVIVQHMPPGFTRSLADRLDETSTWHVKEAASGDRMLCGRALLAPGGFHLTFNCQGEAALTSDPPENNVRPAVDVTMRCLVDLFGSRILGIVLTGMGRDGTEGALLIHRAGGRVIAEAESTCAVYGMPRSVVDAGAADYVAPLPEIPALIHQVYRRGAA